MSVMKWDQIGERYFEAGVKKVALFKMDNGTYGVGVPWNGVSKISESPDGADNTDLWANDSKYASFRAAEKFGGSIEAYTYPDEWAECDGSAEIATGVTIGMQTRKVFGLAYITTIGNDTEQFDAGYKLHLVYGATTSPSSKDFQTINDNPDAISFSWDFDTTPVDVTGFKPTSHIEISSVKADATALAALEAIIYGSNSAEPRLPLPDEVMALMGTAATYPVTLNPVGGTLAAGKDIHTYTTGTAVALPVAADITKEGYTFSGWVEINDVSTVVTTIPADATGPKSYIATWTET